MNFNGWVAMRRSILDKPRLGLLSNNETLVLMTLILLADSSTGSGTINAPSLRSYLPELSYSAAKRILESLQRKRFIYRQIKPFSKAVYPYWINDYEVSRGPRRLSRISLAKVFETKDIKRLEYIKSALQGGPQHEPQGEPDPEPEGVLNNDKDTNQDQEKNKPFSTGEGDFLVTENATTEVSAHDAPKCDRRCDGFVINKVTQDVASMSCVNAMRSGAGLRWSGIDGAYLDISSGRPVPMDTARKRFEKIGLRLDGGLFTDVSTQTVISWDEAQQRIRGIDGVQKAA